VWADPSRVTDRGRVRSSPALRAILELATIRLSVDHERIDHAVQARRLGDGAVDKNDRA
jgi:hypothetical protein